MCLLADAQDGRMDARPTARIPPSPLLHDADALGRVKQIAVDPVTDLTSDHEKPTRGLSNIISRLCYYGGIGYLGTLVAYRNSSGPPFLAGRSNDSDGSCGTGEAAFVIGTSALCTFRRKEP